MAMMNQGSTMSGFPRWDIGATDDPSDEDKALALLGYAPGRMFDPNAPTNPNVPPGSNAPNSTQALYKLMLGQAPYGAQERALARSLARANELRKTPAPEGLNPTGRVYTAANPLEFLAAGLDRYQGETQTRDYERKQDALFKARMRALGVSEDDIARAGE